MSSGVGRTDGGQAGNSTSGFWRPHGRRHGDWTATRAGRDLSALTKAAADNVFMLKVTYWLSR